MGIVDSNGDGLLDHAIPVFGYNDEGNFIMPTPPGLKQNRSMGLSFNL